MLASPLTTASPYAPARSILHYSVTLRPVWVAFTMYQDCTFRQRICTPSYSLRLLFQTFFSTQYLYSTSHFVCIDPSPHLLHLLFLSLHLFHTRQNVWNWLIEAIHPSLPAAATTSASPTRPPWDRPHDVAFYELVFLQAATEPTIRHVYGCYFLSFFFLYEGGR